MPPSNHLEVRDAYDSEREHIRNVTRAAYAEYATIMPAPFWEMYWDRLQATLEDDGPRECIVAVDATGIVGSVLLYPPLANAYGGLALTIPTPEVRLLAVVPSARGRGVGSLLMDACIRRARRMGATHVGLHTMDVMEGAVRMYERMGFVHSPAADFHPAEGIVVKGYYRPLDND